jgi:hypothetical protein
MRVAHPALFLFSCLVLPLSLIAQQSTVTTSTQEAVSDPRALALIQQSFTAMTGQITVGDVTLQCTARRVAGSDDETGTATLKALTTGEMRLDFDFPSGRRSEVRTVSSDGNLMGNWSGRKGVSHLISNHNLMADSTWFFPAFSMSRLASSKGYIVSYIGQENRDGTAVTHVKVLPQLNVPRPRIVQVIQYHAQRHIYLDASTSLPVALDFNTHPENNLMIDIPVEIRFLDYRTVQGVQIPFHVQKYIHNNLVLDIQVQTATLNSGLTAGSLTTN